MKRLLFVEDEIDLTDYLEERLEEYQYQIDIADDAPSAIEKLSSNNYEVVILDLKYTGFGSAYDILSFLKRNALYNNVKIYISTAYVKDGGDLINDFKEFLNPDCLFAKPNGFFDLLDMLESAA